MLALDKNLNDVWWLVKWQIKYLSSTDHENVSDRTPTSLDNEWNRDRHFPKKYVMVPASLIKRNIVSKVWRCGNYHRVNTKSSENTNVTMDIEIKPKYEISISLFTVPKTVLKEA